MQSSESSSLRIQAPSRGRAPAPRSRFFIYRSPTYPTPTCPRAPRKVLVPVLSVHGQFRGVLRAWDYAATTTSAATPAAASGTASAAARLGSPGSGSATATGPSTAASSAACRRILHAIDPSGVVAGQSRGRTAGVRDGRCAAPRRWRLEVVADRRAGWRSWEPPLPRTP